MNIALINGSPKVKDSVSGNILSTLKKLLNESHNIYEYKFNTPQVDHKDIEEIAKCSSIVLAFPLYVDGIPSHLLSCLVQMESYFRINTNPNISVYALVNCGFYEGQQAIWALEMVENWCIKSYIRWGQGIGIGGGGMLSNLSVSSSGQGITKNLWEGLNKISNNISNSISADNIFVSPNFPRFLYKTGGAIGWNKKIKSNGLNKRDLNIRL